MAIFYYAFHSKPHATDKLHIIVRLYHKDPEGPIDQRDAHISESMCSRLSIRCNIYGQGNACVYYATFC
jgi:hypothetical protein